MHLPRCPQPGGWRFIALLSGLVILTGGGFVWLSSLLHLLVASWASLLGPSFTVAGAVLALVQWLWPLPSTRLAHPVQNKGKLQVKVAPLLCGMTIYADLCEQGFHAHPPHTGLAAIVTRRWIMGKEEFLAEFELVAGNYTISMNSWKYRADITIMPGTGELIDWSSIQP